MKSTACDNISTEKNLVFEKALEGRQRLQARHEMMLRGIFCLLLTVPAIAFKSTFVRGTAPLSAIKSKSSLCMKTIAVFGASGLTASECVYQALKDGDKVVGLTR